MQPQQKKIQTLYDAAFNAKEHKNFDMALQLFQQIVELDSSSHRPFLGIAMVLIDQRKFSEAIKVVRKVIKRWPDWPDLDLAYSILGSCYKEQKQVLKAEDTFRKALEIKPRTWYWVFLHELLVDQGRNDEAIQCLKKALKLDPNYDEAHYNLGCEYKKRGQFSQAEQYFRRAIELDPKYSRAYAELGWVLQTHKNEVKEAVQLYRKSIRLDPNYGWSHLYLGVAYERLGKIKAAEKQYLKALEIWPDSPQPYWCYGGFLRDIGGRDFLAEEYLRKAVELEPKDQVAHYELGKGLLKWNRIREATRFLKKAAKLGDDRARKLLETIK